MSTPVPELVTLRGPGWRASVPTALIVALVTVAANAGVTRCAGPASSDELSGLRADVRDQGKDITAIKADLKNLVDRVNRVDDDSRNARVIEALKGGAKP